jgi:ribosomal protein S18 acetylase RimI-like enzyme
MWLPSRASPLEYVYADVSVSAGREGLAGQLVPQMSAGRNFSAMASRGRVSVRRAAPADETEVGRFGSAFDFDVLEDETKRFLADERHHLLLGYVNDTPAGFLSAVEVFHPDKRPELFLNEIAVVPEMRRQGVGRVLIGELVRLGRERGFVTIWVLTDEANGAAMRMYRATGGRWDGSHQVMFEYDLLDST